MLKRQIFVVSITLLMTLLTYQLPYMTGQEIVVNVTESPSADITQSNNEEIDRLLAKKSLTEEEFQLLKKYTSENTQKIVESFEAKEVDIYSHSNYSKIRKSSLLWLFLIWAVFFALVPIRLLEFFEAIILPVLFGVIGLIVAIELVVIIALAVSAYVVKRYLLPNNRINGQPDSGEA